MRERPILMCGEMVRATLDDRKNKTRRVINPQPPNGANHPCFTEGGWRWWIKQAAWPGPSGRSAVNYLKCPQGVVGDRLWVRETFAEHPEVPGQWIYRADHGGDYQGAAQGDFKWKPSIFMPRRASRLTLEIVSVRVERLQEISEADAIAEGLTPGLFGNTFIAPGFALARDAVGAYEALWDSLNRKTFPWSSNPFVFVIEFKRYEQDAKPV